MSGKIAALAVSLFIVWCSPALALRFSDIQAMHDALPAWGGVIDLPAEEINGGNGEEIVITKPVKIRGKGMNMSDAQASRAVTQLNYSGSGVAITIGTTDQTAPLYGVELSNFGLRNAGGDGIAGIRITGNIPQGILTARVLIENVDVRFFNGRGTGFDLNYGISITLRRTHAHLNMYGYRVRFGNAYDFDGIIARHNAQGVRIDQANGLTVRGRSVIESNDGPGILALIEDHSEQITIKDSWIEGNNVLPSSIQYQIYFAAAVPGARFKAPKLHGLNIETLVGQGIGDIYIDHADSPDTRHISTNSAAGRVILRHGSSVTNRSWSFIEGPNGQAPGSIE
jgi:hypothetical protein